MRSLVPLLALALAIVPATLAAPLVEVTLTVDYAAYPPARGAAAHARACAVAVPAGAHGGAVLDAAVAAGCLSEWRQREFSFGTFVTCVDRVCGDETTGLFLTYWSLHFDGKSSSVGIDGFSAGKNRELGLAYVSWLAYGVL